MATRTGLEYGLQRPFACAVFRQIVYVRYPNTPGRTHYDGFAPLSAAARNHPILGVSLLRTGNLSVPAPLNLSAIRTADLSGTIIPSASGARQDLSFSTASHLLAWLGLRN